MPRKKAGIKRKVKATLGLAMNPQDAKEIVEELVAEVETTPKEIKGIPGETVSGNKVAWTYKEIVKRFPIVTFTPDETIPLTWNGIEVWAMTNQEMHVPDVFYKLYQKHHRGKDISKELPPGITVSEYGGSL